MHAIARRSQGLLKSTKSSSWGMCSSCQRSFSGSAVKRRIDQYPSFHESSSSELDAHLVHARQKALLPYFINQDQRRLIIREENRTRLEYDPVYIKIGSVEERLEYVDIKSGVPSAYKVFKKAIELAETSKDWENIARLLRGFTNTAHGLEQKQKEWITRKMIESDCLYIVMQLLHEAPKTAVTLKQEGLRNRVLYGIFQLAADSEWDEANTKKALNFSEQVVSLLEKPEHGGGSRVANKNDARTNPFVAALPLEMAALRAKMHLNGKDEDSKVAKYASRLMGIIEQHGIPKDVPTDAEFNTERGPRVLWELWIPVWHSLKLAQDILGSAMPQSALAEETRKRLGSQITSACERLRAKDDFSEEPAPARYWRAVQ